VSRLVYSMLVSLDGFIEGPDRELDWHLIDEELHTFFNDQARAAGAFLYGRRLYELMAAHWPTADQDPSAPAYVAEFARIWRDKPKVVFSRTLDKVEWNSRLVRDGAADEVARLKAQPGGELQLGGPNLASTFMRLGMIDEYGLAVQPVVIGGGTPYFPASVGPVELRLVATRTFASGVVDLRYERAGDEGTA
jgi:dihydrofolate reductase